VTGIVTSGTGAGGLYNNQLSPNTSLEAHILGHEGYREQVYLDSKYLPTIGIGGLVTEYPRFAAYDFYANGVKLNDSQKREYYNKVMAYASAAASKNDPMAQNIKTNTISVGTLSDGTRLADIRTSKESIQNEMRKYISTSEQILSKAYKGWGSFPQPAKNALLDIAYGYGVGGIHNIHGLDACVNSQNWTCAADVAARIYAGKRSGPQVIQWFLSAAGS
jgi:GH24 family phage-related lysozyme (muramidase)